MYELLEFDLGRDALKYIIKTLSLKKLHIPYYLCDVVRHTLFQEGCKPIFYHIDDNFLPDKAFNKEDFILYPNYWGILQTNVKKLASTYPHLIVDNAHAYYDEPEGYACFNVGHKFGYEKSQLWINIQNANEKPPAKKLIQTVRQEIFFKLHAKYKNANLLKIDNFVNAAVITKASRSNCTTPNFAPYIYPYLAKSTNDADDLVKELKEEGKTVYRYWSPLPKSFNEYKFYSRLVPIPILPD